MPILPSFFISIIHNYSFNKNILVILFVLLTLLLFGIVKDLYTIYFYLIGTLRGGICYIYICRYNIRGALVLYEGAYTELCFTWNIGRLISRTSKLGEKYTFMSVTQNINDFHLLTVTFIVYKRFLITISLCNTFSM